MKTPVGHIIFIGFYTICLLCNCNPARNTEQYTNMAQQLFSSIYGGDPSLIDSLVSDDVVSSYPIFEQLFGTKAIRGREALKEFAVGFGERWNKANVVFHEAIAEDNRVALLWSFKATRMVTAQDSSVLAGQQYSWGGITLFHFDEEGKITAEYGEESTPGPFARLE